MIGKLITIFFNFLLTIIMTLVQIIMLPFNLLFDGIFPNFSDSINTIDSAFSFISQYIGWGVALIPPLLRTVMLMILTIELSLLVIFRSTHLTAKAWALLQKIKFW